MMLESGENILLKDLTEIQLRALCSGMIKYMIKMSSDLAEWFLGKDPMIDEQKN